MSISLSTKRRQGKNCLVKCSRRKQSGPENERKLIEQQMEIAIKQRDNKVEELMLLERNRYRRVIHKVESETLALRTDE